MSEGVFRFKRFEVRNEKASMKVNTDAVILGAAVGLQVRDGFSVLDVGTGTGVIALMLAQRLSERVSRFRVEGVDLDNASAEEAALNFSASPWTENLFSFNEDFRGRAGVYDLIVSNPPFFEDSQVNPDSRKRLARHAGKCGDGLSCRTLLDFAAERLSRGGRAALILPASACGNLVEYAAGIGFSPFEILYVRADEAKAPYRAVMQFCRKENPSLCAEQCRTSELAIRSGHGEGGYTARYASLVRDFYLWA